MEFTEKMKIPSIHRINEIRNGPRETMNEKVAKVEVRLAEVESTLAGDGPMDREALLEERIMLKRALTKANIEAAGKSASEPSV